MRRLFAWIVTLVIGILVLALSALFAVMQSPKGSESLENTTRRPARPVPHSIENRKNCNQCHLPGKIIPYPAEHSGLPEDGCTECHRAQ